MEKVKDLKDLLTKEIQDLHSVEEQIIEALPKMIEKAGNAQLRDQLDRHLRITEEQKNRLEKIKELMAEGVSEQGEEGEQKRSFLANLFSRNKEQKCQGMEGIIKEGEKILNEPMEPQVVDAAIIACAQKVEHYEICGYGTARAYARELNLTQVADLLTETLEEEYEADDRLTELALGRSNEEAVRGNASRNQRLGRGASKGAAKGGGRSAGSKGAAKGGSRGSAKSASKGGSKTASKKGASKKTASTKGAAKKGAGKGGSKAASKGGGGTARKGAPSKASAAKGGRNSRGGRGR